jgi:hypothetical protein
MKGLRLLTVALLAGAAATASAQVSVGVEATIGGQRLGVERAPITHDALVPMGDFGGTILLKAGALALGAAAEGNWDHSTLQRYNASALGGLALDVLPVLRVELLGEYGAANLRTGGDLASAVASEGGWSRFYGFRPGLSVKLPAFPLRVGVWGLARWGLPGTGPGPSYGMLGRVGLEF